LTANLAVALAQSGKQVGVLDADVYGHSIPHVLGIHQKPVLVDKMIIPPDKHELKLMSIGFFLDENQPVMWRGPMLHRALEQFLTDVHWGELDVLVVDMPPGTGDVAISLGQLLPRAETIVVTTPQPAAQEVASRAGVMAQKTGMRLVGVVENLTGDVFGTGDISISLGQLLPRAEVVVVTTPQKLAQDVASRAASMARKTNMRLLGVIENMTGEVFGSGGGEALAAQLDVPLLGQVPLDPLLRLQGDLGEPIVASHPDSETAQTIVAIAETIDARREAGSILKSLPLVG
jgi:ATP-binding protein involved in chromosome partitioning